MSKAPLAVLLLSLFAGCSAGTEKQVASPQPSQRGALGDATLGYAQVMASKSIDGAPITEDSRATAMVVFASWCGHCRKELAVLAQLRE